MVAQAKIILQDEKQSLTAVKKLVSWVSQEVKDNLVDSFSALEVLRIKEGECQAHTYLYTALSRAAGIPTRVVSGLVYLEGMGFLYHSWAESFIGYWIAVDPTFGQAPADASHIKLIEGERLEDLSPLINVIGHLKVKVIDYQ
jgi:transglutaminase-like putative cysteine protease